jgi:hypothetical protein
MPSDSTTDQSMQPTSPASEPSSSATDNSRGAQEQQSQKRHCVPNSDNPANCKQSDSDSPNH